MIASLKKITTRKAFGAVAGIPEETREVFAKMLDGKSNVAELALLAERDFEESYAVVAALRAHVAHHRFPPVIVADLKKLVGDSAA